MPSFADLCIQAPLVSHGVPSGIDAWNLSVEVAMPTGGALLGDDAGQPGTFIIGTSTLSAFSWYDATERMQGVQIERGGSAGDRPEPGTALIQLDNTDKTLSPWSQDDYFLGIQNPFLGPGTLVRVSAHNLDNNPIEDVDLFSDFTIGGGITNTGTLLKYPFTFGSPFAATSTSTSLDFQGSHVQLETAKFPSGNSTSLFCYFGVYKTSGSTDDYIEISKTPAGNMTFNITKAHVSNIVTLAGCQHRFWQISESSGTVTIETSAEGYVWTTQHSAPTPNGITAMFVKVHNANSAGAGSDLTAANGWWVAGVNTRQISATWQPLFTGLVESWEETREALNGTGSITVTAIETLSVLAQYDINALGAVVGLGDTISQRIRRLGDAADWQFEYFFDGNSAYTYQSTDMSQNRLAEMYLTADSMDSILFSGRDGRIWCVGQDTQYMDEDQIFFTGYSPGIDLTSTFPDSHGYDDDDGVIGASLDDFTTKNNDDLIIGTITLARVGGTAVTYEDAYLSKRYQPRTYTRNDLITQDPGSNADLAFVASQILTRSDQTYRPDTCVVDGKYEPKNIKFIFSLDVGITVTNGIQTDDVVFYNPLVANYSLRIAPLNDLSLDITAEIQFQPGVYAGWYAN